MYNPMLAERAEEPFDSPAHFYEVKYDGARCLAYVADGKVKLLARSGVDHTAGFPELHGLPQQLNAAEAVLDGELIMEVPDGSHDFRKLQSRIHQSKPLAVQAAARLYVATYMVFDVLQLNGVDLTARGQRVPQEDRKALLAELLEPGPRCRVVEHVDGHGIAFFQECIRRGLEGVMAKDRRGLYHPGKRHTAWLKVKGVEEDSFVVGGYTAGEGWREGLFGSLLLGQPDGQAGLRYCGSVGTGFTQVELQELLAEMRPLETARCPFKQSPYEPKLASYLEPRLVVDVKYHEETPDRRLRFPVFIRLRRDQHFQADHGAGHYVAFMSPRRRA